MRDFQLDFDIRQPGINLRPPATDDAVRLAEWELDISLPPSYRWWLTRYADGAEISMGNALFLHPLLDPGASAWGSVVQQTQWCREEAYWNLKDIVVFGMSGVDSEMYAFYTGCKDNTGEYPVIWASPALADEDGYVLLNTRFDRFLNVKVQDLQATNSLDLNEEGYDSLSRKLYSRYDPSVPMTDSDMYEVAVDAATLKWQAARLMNDKSANGNHDPSK